MPPPIPTGAKAKATKNTPVMTSSASMVSASIPVNRFGLGAVVAVHDVASHQSGER